MNTYTITIYKTIQQNITKFLRNNRSIELSLNNKLRVTLNPKISPSLQLPKPNSHLSLKHTKHCEHRDMTRNNLK